MINWKYELPQWVTSMFVGIFWIGWTVLVGVACPAFSQMYADFGVTHTGFRAVLLQATPIHTVPVGVLFAVLLTWKATRLSKRPNHRVDLAALLLLLAQLPIVFWSLFCYTIRCG